MNIERTSAAQPPHIPTNLDTPAASAPPVRDEVPERHDRIELSGAARDAAQLSEGAREARVEALRAQVEAGTYQVDADALAKLLADQAH